MKKYIYLLIVLTFCNGLVLANQIRSNFEKEDDIQKLKLILKELSKNIYLQRIDLIAPLIHPEVGISIADNTISKDRFIKRYKKLLYEPISKEDINLCKSSEGKFLTSPYAMYEIYRDNLVINIRPSSHINNNYMVGFSSGKKIIKYDNFKCSFFTLPMTFEKIDGQFYWTWLQ